MAVAQLCRGKNCHTVTVTVPYVHLQVQYSLLYRRPETNGVFEACKENGVTLVAYSPLCQGLLTGQNSDAGPAVYIHVTPVGNTFFS
jgi:aryl-alcohol dehydrogenase-like predicted oxidoreductase